MFNSLTIVSNVNTISTKPYLFSDLQELPKDGQVFVAIVNSKNPLKTADHLCAVKISVAFHATSMCYPVPVDQIIVNGDDCSQYIYISHA